MAKTFRKHFKTFGQGKLKFQNGSESFPIFKLRGVKKQ